MPKPPSPNPQIDRALIEHLCELARLRLPSERQTALQAQLAKVVQAFSTLAEAGEEDCATAGEAPVGATLTTPELRVDAAEQPPSSADVLANAPQTATDCFVVPRVVES